MSRSTLLVAGGISWLALAAVPLSAQSAPEQSSDELVCQLTGECGGTTAAPASAARTEPTGEARAPRRAALTRGFSVRPATTPPAQERPAFRIVPADKSNPRYSAPGNGSSASLTHRGRADLRITFVSGSSTLTEQAKINARQMVTALQSPALAGARFAIEGHTDAVGSRASNLTLSRSRAQAVVDYLVARGADRSRFEVHGYGFDRPIEPTDMQSAKNRRVEIVKLD